MARTQEWLQDVESGQRVEWVHLEWKPLYGRGIFSYVGQLGISKLFCDQYFPLHVICDLFDALQ